MALQVCCGADGLMMYTDRWQQTFCPLPSPQLIAADHSGQYAVVDNTQQLLWSGDHLFPVDPGVEKLLLWRGHPLVLSGETNTLTLLDPSTGAPMFLAPAGIYPQDMCFLSEHTIAVGGGEDAMVHIFRLPELSCEKTLILRGAVQRIAIHRQWLYVLCDAVGESHCMLQRVHPASMRYELLLELPGPSGTLYCGHHGLWVAAGECLCRLHGDDHRLLHHHQGFGWIRYIIGWHGALLLSDVAQGALYRLPAPARSPELLLKGNIGQAAP